MREQARAANRTFCYPRPATFPDERDVERARDEGKPVVVRFKTVREDVVVHDEVMGPVKIAGSELDDFIIQKAGGIPTYHLANVVDDGAMGVNLVMRGQEFLAQTPRHITLQRALGLATPRYAHMPLTMDMKGRKLSKRDGAVHVNLFREAGYLPEALLNFIALLGWSPGGDREKMTPDEMVELFSLARMNRVNAKFDRDKLRAFNTDALAAASEDRLVTAFDDYCDLNDSSMCRADLDDATKRALLRANRGIHTFADIETKSSFLFVADDAIAYDPAAVKKVLAKGDNAGFAMLETLLPELESADPWSPETLEAIIHGVCSAKNVGMGKVAQPIRVAVTGSTISPSIHDTLVLLGKERTLARIRRAVTLRV